MKAIEAPEKIYIFEEDLQREDHIVKYGINQDKDIMGLVEYTRTDAFIDKACEFFMEKFDVEDYNDNIYVDDVPTFNYDRFITDFKIYMKGG